MKKKLQNCSKYIRKIENAIGNIMIVQGFTCSFKDYIDYWIKLFPKYNLYAINPPGHEDSSFDSVDELDVNHYTQIYKAYIEELKLKSVILVGHSMGGGISLKLSFLLKNTNIIENVIIMNPMNLAVLDNFDVVKKLIPEKLEDTIEVIKSVYYDHIKFFKSEEIFLEICKNIYLILTQKLNHLKAMLEYDKVKMWATEVQEIIDKLDYKVLLILGQNDNLILANDSIKNFKNNKNIEIVVIPKCGHNPFMEKHNETKKIIKKYLNSRN